MNAPANAADSVGIIKPAFFHCKQSLSLECGTVLDSFDLIYETYGELNADGSNAILICHALSGDHHAAGYHSPDQAKPGWWDNMIGPGKPIDTRRFYVVCPNNLGGCGGSSGPLAIDSATGKEYGPNFPFVTVRDWVRSQAQLADHLHINRWAAVIGGSLGGMQAMQWALDYPDRLEQSFIIAGAARLSTQNIAFNEVARQAIRSDPDYHDGYYREHNTIPQRGLMLARMLGHITYLSDDIMRRKFGRSRQQEKRFDYSPEFDVESYLHHQGESFVDRFDANSYLLMTKSLDYFDPAEEYDGDLVATLRHAKADFHVLSFSTDWRFSPARSREIVDALINAGQNVSYVEIASERGHDSFLLPIESYHEVMRAAMDRLAIKLGC